jgi:hypothetical protein
MGLDKSSSPVKSHIKLMYQRDNIGQINKFDLLVAARKGIKGEHNGKRTERT